MIDSLTDMSMEGTFTIEEADLKKLQEVLCDIKIEECPWFEVHDKYGKSAKYYRDGLIDTKTEKLSNNSPKVDSDSGELIRCRKCRYKEKKGVDYFCDHITGEEIMVSPNDYCSWAEKED